MFNTFAPIDSINRSHPLLRGCVGWWLCLPGLPLAGFVNLLDRTSPNLVAGASLSGIGSSRPGGRPAVQLDLAAAQYVDAGNPPSVQITGAITVSAWVYTKGSPDNQIIVAKDADTGGRAYTLDTYFTGQARWYINGGAT